MQLLYSIHYNLLGFQSYNLKVASISTKRLF